LRTFTLLLARERERKGVKDTDKKKKDEGEEINEKGGGESGAPFTVAAIVARRRRRDDDDDDDDDQLARARRFRMTGLMSCLSESCVLHMSLTFTMFVQWPRNRVTSRL